MNKLKYNNLALKLCDEVPETVEYFEINYEEDKDSFLEHTKFDGLDFSLNIKMKSGKEFGFIWGSEFTQYGVSIIGFNLKTELSTYRNIDVSTSNNWNKFIGNKIVDVEVIWHWVKENGFLRRKKHYPQSIVLTFTNDENIIISAMEISDSTFWGMADNTTIFFNKQTAYKYNVL